jgi:hypothetical protein
MASCLTVVVLSEGKGGSGEARRRDKFNRPPRKQQAAPEFPANRTTEANHMEKTYNTAKQEAARLTISIRSFRDMVRNGIVPHYAIGRRQVFCPQDTDRALDARFRKEAPMPA